MPIGAKAAEAFDGCIDVFWSKIPVRARRRGYLSTDVTGRHLQIRAFNRLLEVVRVQVAGVPEFVEPHAVRRSWNGQLSATIDAFSPDKRPSEIQEVRMKPSSGVVGRIFDGHSLRQA